ncbi:hypothetical protein I79_024124 [Cricetulus griseus]|uniref:Uncharacterized protein n=1 Tax=Cricetulus griseus TaxID=10029 RepID=G3IJT6_CRIGR|nr:hypothetical protein I79_024124 [Cricetulus griseus]
MEPELSIFGDQARLPVVALGHQPNHRTLTYKFSCLQDALEQWWPRNCGVNQGITGSI